MNDSELPAPNSQALLSCCYVADPKCVIPTSDPNFWGLLSDEGGRRDLLGILTTEELLTALRDDWTASITQYNARKATEATQATPVSQEDLDDILSDLTLDF